MPESQQKLHDLIVAMPPFYAYAHTTGKFNGYLVHSIYPLADHEMNIKILDEMQKRRLIRSFLLYDIVDYELKRPNLDFFDPQKGWQWNWEKWTEEAEKNLSKTMKNPISIVERPPLTSFDSTDIEILKHLIKNPSITLKEIGKRLGISDSIVAKRISNLESEGVIKGYKPAYDLRLEKIYVWLFLDLDDNAPSVISSLYTLPFSMIFSVEPPCRYAVRLNIPTNHFNQFVKSFECLRRLIPFCAVQIAVPVSKQRNECFTNLYNKENCAWELPSEEYVESVKKHVD